MVGRDPAQAAEETCAGGRRYDRLRLSVGKRKIANDEVLEIVTSVFPTIESDPFLESDVRRAACCTL